MISIICPCYNSEKHLHVLLECLYNQINVNIKYEIIFVDDGSNDMSLDILKENKEKFLQKGINYIVLSQQHKGPGAARNYGIKKAKYNYISFIDADDIWYPDKLSICALSIIEKNHLYNVFTHDEIYKRQFAKDKIISNGDIKGNISESLYKKNYFSTSAMIINKKLIEDAGYFDEKLMSSQDYDLWLKMSKKMKIFKIKKVLGEYIENPLGITSKNYSKRVKDQITIAIKYRHYVKYHFFIYKIIKILISKQWLHSFINAFLKRRKHNY